ncbi:MAG TPA: nuclear transport factor 2 family protein [Thermoleophilaceae bacterium]|nr:nuclear transport factor 2 family protein [Thermoleophilaceae bacterium]
MGVLIRGGNTLAARVQRLEDVEAISRLMSAYGRSVDDDYDLDSMAELLTHDLVWESNEFGSYHSRDEYIAGQREIARGVRWGFHHMVPVSIKPTGSDTASGVFYLLMLATFADAEGEEPMVISARYENQFRRGEDGWRCSRMNVNFHQVSPLTVGWVRERFWSAS